MTRSISNAKIISALIIDQCSIVSRRGYASASQGGVTESVRWSVVSMVKKGSEELKKSTAWIPDPVTGYYKPEGCEKEIDPAELREILLKQKTLRDSKLI